VGFFPAPIFALVLTVALALPLVAAGGLALAPHAIPASAAARHSTVADVGIDAGSWSVTVPARIPAGLVRFTLKSQPGPMPASASIAQLNSGVSRAQVIAALKKGDEMGLFSLTTALGGPRGSGAAADILRLGPGSYVVYTASQDAKGKPQAKYTFVSVAASTAPVVEPATDASVHLLDMKFKMPDHLRAGTITLKIYNTGPSAHEFALGKLHAGKTVKDLVTYFGQQNPSGPPPADIAGGASPMASGHTQWATVTFTPGTYAAVCFMPDKQGKPHVMDGMYKQFTVR